MAREAKKDPNELTVEQKLKTLFQLQTMLSKIDEIKTLRGELPLEVQDLEDEIAGLSTRIDKIKAEVDELKSAIAGKRVEIETAKASVEKYKSSSSAKIAPIITLDVLCLMSSYFISFNITLFLLDSNHKSDDTDP